MKIKTITCHEVYNVGASLQAYALSCYLRMLGHDVEIIDYKPDYLAKYKLLGVGNPKYDKIFLRELYQLAKLPGRLIYKYGRRKKEFDRFTKKYLLLTQRKYRTNEELKEYPPEADIYLAGSDQIWNTAFNNGKDPAFYLDFAPDTSIKASYAASFATEDILENWKPKVTKWLKHLDFISVREASGVEIIKRLGVSGVVQVLDPVFLIEKDEWKQLEKKINKIEPYVLVYDFDNNKEINDFASDLAKKNGWKVYSFLKNKRCDRCFDKEGPGAFLWLIHHAEYVISNSFHATAFSIIYRKPFVVFNRKEAINTRMRDLVMSLKLDKCLIQNEKQFNEKKIDYDVVYEKVNEEILKSKNYILKVCGQQEN